MHFNRDRLTDAISLANTQDRGINVSRAGLKSTVSVCDRASGVVVKMCFDVRSDASAKGSDLLLIS
jgi:hypothetical protein